MKKYIHAAFFMCVLSLCLALSPSEAAGQDEGNTQKAVAAVEEMVKDLDQENILKITREENQNEMAEWFKGMCKSNKTLGEILTLCEEIDDGILVFKDIKPANIHENIWIRYFNMSQVGSRKIRETVEVISNKRSRLVQIFEETGVSAGYVLAAVSIAQDIYGALGSNDERRLKAVFTTAKNVSLEFLMKRAGYSLNPFISIGIDVLEWGLNTFIKQSIDEHRRDWETAYERYMDKHYPDEYWIKLINNTFSEYGGLSQAQNEIQTTLNRFWQNPDLNFYDIMGKRSTFSSTRGGALAENYKKTFIAQYYNWRIKPKITVKLQQEIGYAKDEARFAANNAIEDLLNNFNEDELKNLRKAIALANDFKQAELLIKPESVTLKPGESQEFSAVLKIGGQNIPVTESDVQWSQSGGTFIAEKSMAGKTLKITASFSGKNGGAEINVKAEDEELEADLSAVRSIAGEMKDVSAEAQLLIREGNDLCRSGNAALVKIRQQLVLHDEKPVDSPLYKYDRIHLSLRKQAEILESLEISSDDDYISAGLNKKECQEQSMEACDGAYVLLSIRNAIIRGSYSASDPDRDPGKIKRAVDIFASKSKEYGDKSLADIKKVEEISQNAEEEFRSMKKSRDDYLMEIQQAKETQGDTADKASADVSGGLDNTGSALRKLELNIGELEKAEALLESKLKKGQTFLLRHPDNGETQSLSKQITGYYEELRRDLKGLRECRDRLKTGIKTIRENNPDREKINYDSRENRDKLGRLHILVRQAEGHLTGIRENARMARSLKSSVEQAVKSAAQCSQKAQEFFNEINRNQTESQDSGFSDAGAVSGEPDPQAGAGDADRCLSLNKEFYDFVMKNPVVYEEENRKKAFAILNRARDCPWYEDGLKVLSMQGAPPEDAVEGGFSDAGATTGEKVAAASPSETPAFSEESDPLLGDWINEFDVQYLDEILKGTRKVNTLRFEKSGGGYSGKTHVFAGIFYDFSMITQKTHGRHGLRPGQELVRVKTGSGNHFSGECFVAKVFDSPVDTWTKCKIEKIDENKISIVISPPKYKSSYDGTIVTSWNGESKRVILHRLQDNLLGDWIRFEKNKNPQSALEDFHRNPDDFSLVRIVKKDDVYLVLLHIIRKERGGIIRPNMGWNCWISELQPGELLAELKQVSENQFVGRSFLCCGSDPNRRRMQTECYVTLLNNDVFEFYADIPPDYPNWKPPEHPSKTVPLYYVKTGESSDK